MKVRWDDKWQINVINCFPAVQKHWTTANSCSHMQRALRHMIGARVCECTLRCCIYIFQWFRKAAAAAHTAHLRKLQLECKCKWFSKSILQSMWSHLCWQDSLFFRFLSISYSKSTNSSLLNNYTLFPYYSRISIFFVCCFSSPFVSWSCS